MNTRHAPVPVPVARFVTLGLVATLGCSAHSDGGGGGGGNGVSLGYACPDVCARFAGQPACVSTAVSDCIAQCQGIETGTPAACSAQVSALGACVTHAPIDCVRSPTVGFVGCDLSFAAVAQCAGSVHTDAGNGG